MADNDLHPTAIEAFLLAHAILARLEAKGILDSSEARQIIQAVDFAMDVLGHKNDPARGRAAAALKTLIGAAGSN
jgi:hypothetical protein